VLFVLQRRAPATSTQYVLGFASLRLTFGHATLHLYCNFIVTQTKNPELPARHLSDKVVQQRAVYGLSPISDSDHHFRQETCCWGNNKITNHAPRGDFKNCWHQTKKSTQTHASIKLYDTRVNLELLCGHCRRFGIILLQKQANIQGCVSWIK
jgi:hypothetical protein